MKLRLEPPENFRPDDLYAKLIAVGANKSDRDARQAMAALVLLLINQIPDPTVIDEAISLVRTLPPPDEVSRKMRAFSKS
jgi:hypothetical protein